VSDRNVKPCEQFDGDVHLRHRDLVCAAVYVKLKHVRGSSPMRCLGLANVGNTCHINSSVQLLRAALSYIYSELPIASTMIVEEHAERNPIVPFIDCVRDGGCVKSAAGGVAVVLARVLPSTRDPMSTLDFLSGICKAEDGLKKDGLKIQASMEVECVLSCEACDREVVSSADATSLRLGLPDGETTTLHDMLQEHFESHSVSITCAGCQTMGVRE